jgi:hypothetical protein
MNTNNVISVNRLKTWIHAQILCNEMTLREQKQIHEGLDVYIEQLKIVAACGGELKLLENLLTFIDKEASK